MDSNQEEPFERRRSVRRSLASIAESEVATFASSNTESLVKDVLRRNTRKSLSVLMQAAASAESKDPAIEFGSTPLPSGGTRDQVDSLPEEYLIRSMQCDSDSSVARVELRSSIRESAVFDMSHDDDDVFQVVETESAAVSAAPDVPSTRKSVRSSARYCMRLFFILMFRDKVF